MLVSAFILSKKALVLRSVMNIFLERRPSLSHGTQTLWVFLTDSTWAWALGLPPTPEPRRSPILPAAAVYLIHDPTIIRQSPVGPFLAQGDIGRAIKYIIFQGNTYKWRQREARHFPVFDSEMWHVVNTVNILLRFKHNGQASTFVFCYQIPQGYLQLVIGRFGSAIAFVP